MAATTLDIVPVRGIDAGSIPSSAEIRTLPLREAELPSARALDWNARPTVVLMAQATAPHLLQEVTPAQSEGLDRNLVRFMEFSPHLGTTFEERYSNYLEYVITRSKGTPWNARELPPHVDPVREKWIEQHKSRGTIFWWSVLKEMDKMPLSEREKKYHRDFLFPQCGVKVPLGVNSIANDPSFSKEEKEFLREFLPALVNDAYNQSKNKRSEVGLIESILGASARAAEERRDEMQEFMRQLVDLESRPAPTPTLGEKLKSFLGSDVNNRKVQEPLAEEFVLYLSYYSLFSLGKYFETLPFRAERQFEVQPDRMKTSFWAINPLNVGEAYNLPWPDRNKMDKTILVTVPFSSFDSCPSSWYKPTIHQLLTMYFASKYNDAATAVNIVFAASMLTSELTDNQMKLALSIQEQNPRVELEDVAFAKRALHFNNVYAVYDPERDTRFKGTREQKFQALDEKWKRGGYFYNYPGKIDTESSVSSGPKGLNEFNWPELGKPRPPPFIKRTIN